MPARLGITYLKGKSSFPGREWITAGHSISCLPPTRSAGDTAFPGADLHAEGTVGVRQLHVEWGGPRFPRPSHPTPPGPILLLAFICLAIYQVATPSKDNSRALIHTLPSQKSMYQSSMGTWEFGVQWDGAILEPCCLSPLIPLRTCEDSSHSA